MVQRPTRLRLHSASWRRQGHVRPRYGLERSGIGVLSEGQKVIYELQTDRRTDKTSTVNLKLAA
jgi:hypothetical protein